jgi:hypothetical protein
MTKIAILWIVAATLSGCTISSGASPSNDASRPRDPATQAACNACPKSCEEDMSALDWCVGWRDDAKDAH